MVTAIYFTHIAGIGGCHDRIRCGRIICGFSLKYINTYVIIVIHGDDIIEFIIIRLMQ